MAFDLNPVHLFSGQHNEFINRVESLVSTRRYMKDEIIFWQGDPRQSIYFIMVGVVEIFRVSPAGREQILSRLGIGEGFNLVPARREDAHNPVNARTLEETELLVLSKKDFLLLMQQYPSFSLAIAIYFAQRLRHMTDLVEVLSLCSVLQRLAKFLIDQADSLESRKNWT